MTNPSRYPAQVFWSDEDEGYVAVAPDLPGCSAFGESQQEALEQLHDAIEAWCQAATAAGNPIPEPSKPAEQTAFSGKFLVRMPRELHATLAKSAASEGVSLNQYAVYLLTKRQEQHTAELHALGRWRKYYVTDQRYEHHKTTELLVNWLDVGSAEARQVTYHTQYTASKEPRRLWLSRPSTRLTSEM
jgi:predicted RNase H-like HicB family nuclease